MKKILIITVILVVVFVTQTFAKTMPSSQYLDDYSFIVKKTGNITSSNVAIKISDSIYQYYITDALKTYWNRKEYSVITPELSYEELNYLSKISFYSKDDILKQYIMFKYFNEVPIKINQNNIGDVTDLYIKREEELKDLIATKNFNLENEISIKGDFKIENEYIINNFIPTSNNILYEDNTIRFLDDEEVVSVDFVPKYNCDEVKAYHNETNADLIGFKCICEKNYTVTFNRIIEKEVPEESLGGNTENNFYDNIISNTDEVESKAQEEIDNINELIDNSNFIKDNSLLDNNNLLINKSQNKKDGNINKIYDKEIEEVTNNDSMLTDESLEKKESFETIKVKVPETHKDSMFPFALIFLLGGLIYEKKY